jgi:ABC-type sulfate transport system permease component
MVVCPCLSVITASTGFDRSICRQCCRATDHRLCLRLALSLGDLGAIALFGSDRIITLPWLLYQKLGSYRTDDAAGLALLLGIASPWG